jgi:hypothetical protein
MEGGEVGKMEERRRVWVILGARDGEIEGSMGRRRSSVGEEGRRIEGSWSWVHRYKDVGQSQELGRHINMQERQGSAVAPKA